jgi:hypothetical protein
MIEFVPSNAHSPLFGKYGTEILSFLFHKKKYLNNSIVPFRFFGYSCMILRTMYYKLFSGPNKYSKIFSREKLRFLFSNKLE